jgi:hypothetical protein
MCSAQRQGEWGSDGTPQSDIFAEFRCLTITLEEKGQGKKFKHKTGWK